MKKYIAPKLSYVDLRTEERIAVSDCTGCCNDAKAAEWNRTAYLGKTDWVAATSGGS